MQNFTLGSSNENPSAGLESGVLIHKVEEEDLFERQVAQLGNRINFCHEILIFELVFGKPFNSAVEPLGNRQ